MSRLIVKGLPKRYDEDLVRKLFSRDGAVTDAKVMRTADGRSRQFAFVGFQSETDARRARQALNKTYVDSAQVIVEIARPFGDASIARPWSKYSKGSSRHDTGLSGTAPKADSNREKTHREGARSRNDSEQRKGKNEGRKCEHAEDGGADVVGDETFDMFRDAVAKRSRTPMWTDRAVGTKGNLRKSLVESRKAGGEGHMLERSHVVFDDDDEDEDELYEELPSAVSMEGADNPKSAHADDTGKFSGKSSAKTGEDEANPPLMPSGTADEDIDDEAYFKSKVRPDLSDADDSDDGADASRCSESDQDEDSIASEDHADEGDLAKGDETSTDKPPGSDGRRNDAAHAHKAKELEGIDVTETGRLFVRNLAFSVTADDIETLFEEFGAIADIHLVQDPRTKKSRGVAFVLYVVPENAAKAIAALDGKIFFGRLLHVLPGKPRPQSSTVRCGPESGPGSNTFKEAREAARKESARAGTDAVAFNAMFMSTDAVANVMAERYGVGKADVYGTNDGGDSGSAAVRLAAGEARLQAETSEFFLTNGVNLKVAQEASRAVRRKRLSRTAFLVKNLPARTRESELMDLFSNFGSIERIVLPPTGILAAVVFDSENDAKKAYSSTAYTRMKDAPLYLEWLPGEAISESAGADKQRSTDENPSKHGSHSTDMEDSRNPGSVNLGADKDDTLADVVPQKSVFVKNLNFDTRDEALRKHVLKVLRKQQRLVASLRAATVATRPDKKNPSGPRLSYGYGFLEFASEHDAGEAVKLLQGSSLGGHSLELRMANRVTKASDTGNTAKRRRPAMSKRKPSAKLMVRNVAFEATSRDVKQLFGTFGQIKSIRLPRKQDGTHRGFGFVEFVSKNEATAALDALSTSHLYGRHLVIDYADETLDGFGSLEELQAKAERQIGKRRRVGGTEHGIDGAAEGTGGDAYNDDDAQMMDEMYG